MRFEKVKPLEGLSFLDSLDLGPVLNSVSDAVIFVDPDFHFSYINPAFESLTGWNIEELQSKRIFDLIEPSEREKFHLSIQYSRSEKAPVSIEALVLNRSGESCKIKFIFRPRMRESQLKGILIVGSVSSNPLEPASKSLINQAKTPADKVVEETVRVSEIPAFANTPKKIEEILERITDGFFAVDREWRVVYINHHAEMITMRKREEVLGRNMWEAAPEYIGTNIYRKYHEAMETGQPIQFIEYMPHFDAWYETKLYPSEFGLSSYFKDITEKRRSEQAMQDNIDRLMIALQGSNIGIWDWNVKTGEAYSRGWQSLLGYSKGELNSGVSQWIDLMHPEDKFQAGSKIESYLKGKLSFYEFQHRLLHKDGSYRWMLCRGVSFLDELGEPQRMVGVLVDIDQQKKVEEKMKKLTEDFSRSNRELEQFAAIAAHDLKEPLRMIAIHLQLLSVQFKNEMNTQAETYIQEAVGSSKRLSNLIDALLVYSQAGKESAPLRVVDSGESVRVAVENLAVAIKDSNAKVEMGDLPEVLGDSVQLVQLFQNLISNAIKFRRAEDPKIEIRAKSTKEGYEFSVKDNGVGMEAKYFERIFKIFQRLHSRDYPGTGIGLAVAKKIVERHRGRIWVESSPGEGATFYFTLQKPDLLAAT